MNDQDKRQALRDWIVKTSGKITAAALTDQTPILERRIITSVQVMDLILFIERLSGIPIDVEQLKPGAFRDIDTIMAGFLGEARG